MTILIFLIIFALLIFVHEFGHFIAAKKSGMLVEEFGFGLPPRLLHKKIGETIYSINLIPFGGFVKIFGEEQQELTTKKTDKLRKRAFINKKPWQKTLVMIGGVIGNFLLGWLLISFLFTKGVPVPTNNVTIEQVISSSPASSAGLRINDKILKIAEHPIKTTTELTNLTKKYGGKKVNLLIERSGKLITVALTPRANPPSGKGPLGVVVTSYAVKRYPWYQAPFFGLVEAAKITRQILVELLRTLFLFITLKKPAVEVTGPIGIARYTGEAIKFGQNAVLELMALLSLNLAVINILPFPALDGGRLVFVLYEWIFKKRVNQNFERFLNFFGIVILLTLAVIISVNDIIQLTK